MASLFLEYLMIFYRPVVYIPILSISIFIALII